MDNLEKVINQELVLTQARKRGHYSENVTQLVRWLDQETLGSTRVRIIPVFPDFRSYEQLLKETTGHEIGLSYFVQNPNIRHYCAGLSGLTYGKKAEEIPFFTIYGNHRDKIEIFYRENSELVFRRFSRTFTNRNHIIQILEEIGIINGEGFIAVSKGKKSCVRSRKKTFDPNDIFIFGIHTHPLGLLNFQPSNETNNASRNFDGGDYYSLERDIRRGIYGQSQVIKTQKYLTLPESLPPHPSEVCWDLLKQRFRNLFN